MASEHNSPVKCPQCPVVCPDQERVGYHLKLYHEALKVCPTCGIELADLKEFYLHMNISHDVQKSTLCIYCGGHFHSNEGRNNHIQDVHQHECGCVRCGSRLICYCPAPSECDDSEEPDEEKTMYKEPKVSVSVSVERLLTEEEIKSEINPLPSTSYDERGPQMPLKIEDLSQQTKCAIVTKMHKGKTVTDICKMYELPADVVYEIWHMRDSFVAPKKMGMKSSKHMNKVLDDKLLDWFHKQRADGVQVSGKQLINQAEEFAKECGFLVFNGNIKWLDRFKLRHNISLRPNQVRKEKTPRTPNEAKWKEQFLSQVWPEVSNGYEYEEIYTADEVGVFYNASKGRIRKHTGRKYIHGLNKDRFSIFLCTNITGEDRRRTVVCGTEDPLAHSHRDPKTLPVEYIRQSLAHFTTDMFEEYVMRWNEELKKKDDKAILILDRASIHSKLPLSHLKLVFVPWKASTSLMPIKHGIFLKFREQFRKLVLQEKAMIVQRGIDRNLTCLEGLEMVHKAWNRVPHATIIEGFKLTGYNVPELKEQLPEKSVPDEDGRICKLLRNYNVDEYYTNLTNLDMYLTVDDHLLTAQGTNGSVFGGNHKVTLTPEQNFADNGVILPIGENRPAEREPEDVMMKKRAFEDVARLRKYLYSKNTDPKTFKTLMAVEQMLYKSRNLKLHS